MGIFSRKKKGAGASEEEVPDSEISEATGPFTEEDHPDRGELLDAGALWLPTVEGATVQFSVDKRRKLVLGVVYVKDNSALQLQVFAAPKSSGLWEDIRAELISAIAAQGGKSVQADGEYGAEVHAVMPAGDNKKPTSRVRYVGIDGPRWLLRATATGRAATDDAAASAIMHEVLDQLVVVRGQTPHPPRELLALEIPKKESDTEESERPTLSLPKRGPEISEVR
ncbi:MAG: DUF3710 domain-containing protein [Ancrocorticia sp.]|uniref:DUF3710 domain-containing protein n=1 Tax=Ancrocorticia sp. TaxID=2593684 RepID=UPI003F8E561B